LGLERGDSGCVCSVLSECRARLTAGATEHALTDACRARGSLKELGRRRTDSTRVLGALCILHRRERVAETLRHALAAVAEAEPAWLRGLAPADWFERRGRRFEE